MFKRMNDIDAKDRRIADLEMALMSYKLCVGKLAYGIAILWESVLSGMHDARSLVGDTTLDMQEILMSYLKIDARGKDVLKKSITAALADAGSTPLTDNLIEFARVVIQQECWALDPLDGCEIQDFAERLGFIAKHTVTAEGVDDDFEVGDTIYKFTDVLAEKK